MAQIQLYERSVGVPRTTGFQNQNIEPPTDNSMAAVAEIGNTFGRIGEKLQIAQDEQSVSTATLNATLKMSALTTELSKLEGGIAMGSYDTRSQEIYEKVAGGLSAKARNAFNKSWNQLSAKSQINIKSAAVKRWHKKNNADLLSTLKGFTVTAGANGTSKADRQQSIAEGTKAINAAVAAGTLDALEGEKLKQKHVNDVAKAGINSMIRTSPLEDLDDLFNQMASDSITNTLLKEYWNQLDGTEKQALQNKVSVMHERKVNIAEKREKEGVAQTNRKYDRNFASRMKQIILAKRTNNPDAHLPTLIELTDDLSAGRIDSGRFDKLSAALKNEDPAGSDDPYISSVLGEIREAKTEKELRGIIADMEKVLGPKGKLKFKDFEILERRALAAIGNTPETKRANSYSRALKNVLDSTDFLDKILPGAKDRAAFVQLDFEARILDGEDPAFAFAEALDAFRTRGTVKLNSIPRPQFGPAKKLNEWTLDEVEKAREQTKTEFKGKPNIFAAQMLILNALSSYLGARDAAVKAAKDASNPPPLPNQNKTTVTPSAAQGWFKYPGGGGDLTTSERLLKLRGGEN